MVEEANEPVKGHTGCTVQEVLLECSLEVVDSLFWVLEQRTEVLFSLAPLL